MSRAEKQNTDVEPALADAAALMRGVAHAMQRHPHLDADTVRHTLALLRLDPLTRLNRSLTRGRALAAHRASAPVSARLAVALRAAQQDPDPTE